MIKQPAYGSRNVNDYFYESEGKRIEKMNKFIGDIELTKGEEQTFIWLAGWEEGIVDYILSVIEKTARKRADTVGEDAQIKKAKTEQSHNKGSLF